MKVEVKDKDGNVIGEIYSDTLGNKFARNKEGVLVAVYNSMFKKTIRMDNRKMEANDNTETILNELKDMASNQTANTNNSLISLIKKKGK